MCRRCCLVLSTVSRVGIIFGVGLSRFRVRFHRDSSRDEYESLELYFRAELVTATAAVASVSSMGASIS